MNIEELAEQQYGVVTRAQAAACLSTSAIDRRLKSGRFVPMFPGVYRLAGAPQTGRQRALAAALWADGRVSHLVAARLWRLDELPRPQWVDITVERRTSLAHADLVVHRSRVARIDRVIADGIPCTSAARTLLDCATLVDAETLEAACEQARRMGLTSIPALQRQVGQGRPGSAALNEVLKRADSRPRESRLEVKLARLVRTSRLPEPVAQMRIGAYRVDYAWPAFRIVCECDGFEWHGDRLHWKRDRRRLAAIEAAGWRVVHVTWEDVTRRPQQTLDRLALALREAA